MIKRFVVAPDSFKGTLTAIEICDIVEAAILRHIPYATVHKLPMADGGEGMVDAYLRVCGGEYCTATVTGPLGQPVTAAYGRLDNHTAVMEMASCAGLPLAWGNAEVGQRNPMRCTTRGVGQLLAHMAKSGVTKVIMGLGGSATNDGGIGMAAALGYRFYNEEGKMLDAIAENLNAISCIQKPDNMPQIAVTAACDVDNPLCGPRGASHVYGPQKGATPQQVVQLDKGLQNLAKVIKRCLKVDVLELPGAGAAGGLGAGVVAFLGGSLKPGIQMLLDAAAFDQLLTETDMVITGEGRMDGQSIFGKAPIGVAGRAAKQGVPCIALCGSLGEDSSAVYQHGITAVFPSLRSSVSSLEELKKVSRGNMEHLADAIARTIAALG